MIVINYPKKRISLLGDFKINLMTRTHTEINFFIVCLLFCFCSIYFNQQEIENSKYPIGNKFSGVVSRNISHNLTRSISDDLS